MKVSGVWRMMSLFLMGVIVGILLTYAYADQKVSEGQSITIGRIKIKNSEDIDSVITIDQDKQDKQEKKKKRGLFKRKN